jgi:hypothetical protein
MILEQYSQRLARREAMNLRMILFSGVVTAFIGSMIGLAAARIGQHDFNQLRFESEAYQDLHGKYALIGAGLGLAVGIGQEYVRELKAQRKEEG